MGYVCHAEETTAGILIILMRVLSYECMFGYASVWFLWPTTTGDSRLVYATCRMDSSRIAWRCLLDTIIDISRRILPLSLSLSLLWYAAFISRMSKGSRLSRVRNRMIYGRTMSAAATTITTIIRTTTRTLRWRQSSVRLLTSGGCQSWAWRRRK